MFWTKFCERVKEYLGEDHILGKGKVSDISGRTQGSYSPVII